MKPLTDMLGSVLTIGQQVAYAALSHKKSYLRIGTIDRVDPLGEVLIKPAEKGFRSVWKTPNNVVTVQWV